MDNETAKKLADAMNRLAEAIEKQPVIVGPTYIPQPYPVPVPVPSYPYYPSYPRQPYWYGFGYGNGGFGGGNHGYQDVIAYSGGAQ